MSTHVLSTLTPPPSRFVKNYFEFLQIGLGTALVNAPLPASWRRSYFRLQAVELFPEEDSHLSDTAHSQAREGALPMR